MSSPPPTSAAPDGSGDPRPTTDPPGLVGDPRRQAVDSLNGYAYQIWRSVLAWLDLRDGEALDLEGAEDIDRLRAGGAEAIQVKETQRSGPITLRSADVVAALNNFWTNRAGNAGIVLTMRFVSTTTSTLEKDRPFGERPGLQVWRSLQRRVSDAAVSEDVHHLRGFLVGLEDLAKPLSTWLATASNADLLTELVDRVHWDLDQPATPAIRELVDQQLVLLGHPYGVFPTDAKKARSALLEEALMRATSKGARRLTRPHLLEVFEKQVAVTVPRGSSAASMAISPSPMGSPLDAETAAQRAAQQVLISHRRTTLALTAHVVERVSAAAAIRALAAAQGFVFVQGSTGMGKSILVQQAVAEMASEVLWLDLRDLADVPRLLRQIVLFLGAQRAKVHLILDDLSFAGDSRALQGALESLLLTVGSRGGTVIATGAVPPPATWRMKLGLDAAVVVPAPAFDLASIEALLGIVGMAEGRLRSARGQLILALTSGHPQLVSARVAALVGAGFPALDPEELRQVPADVRETKAQARTLVASLPAQDRELLYRLSLTAVRFRRRTAVAISQVAPIIAEPGNALDRLTGPWIEQIAPEVYRVSPLVQGCGIEVYGPDWAKPVHRELGRSMQAKTMGPDELSGALLHAVAGGDEFSLMKMCAAILMSKQIEVLAGWLPWFLGLLPQSLNCSKQTKILIRMAQLTIASHTDPEEGRRCAEALERESRPTSEADAADRSFRYAALGKILMATPVSIPARLHVEMAQELDGLSHDRRRLRALAKRVGATAEMPEAYDAGMVFASSVHGRVATPAELQGLVEALDQLPAGDRDRLISKIGQESFFATHVVNFVWLTTWKTTDQPWRPLLAALERCLSIVAKWPANALASAIAMVMVRVHNENLGFPAHAREIGESFLQQFGPVPELVDAVADALERDGRPEEALERRLAMLARWRPAKEDTLGPVLSRRRAAISAIKAKRWETASELLRDAARLAKPDGKAFRVGLLADAGLAALRSGQRQEGVDLLLDAIEGLSAIPNAPDVPGDFRVHKMVGHALTVLGNTDPLLLERDLDALAPGLCSDFEVGEGLLESVATPTYFSLLNLLRYGVRMGLVDQRLLGAVETLRNSRLTFIRVMLASAEGALAVLEGRVDEIPRRAAHDYRVRASVQGFRESNLFDESDPPADDSLPDPDFVLTYFVSTLLVLAERGSGLSIAPSWLGADPPSLPSSVAERVARWPHFVSADVREGRRVAQEFSSNHDGAVFSLHVMTEPASTPPGTLSAHSHLLRMLLAGALIPEVGVHLCRWITRYWSAIADEPFLLVSPRVSQLALKAACEAAGSAAKRSARILLAAASALGLSLPAEASSRFQMVVEAVENPRA